MVSWRGSIAPSNITGYSQGYPPKPGNNNNNNKNPIAKDIAYLGQWTWRSRTGARPEALPQLTNIHGAGWYFAYYRRKKVIITVT